MSNDFYTFVGSTWDKILISGYENGKKFNRKVNYEPYLFLPGKGDYRTVDGKKLRREDFSSIREARDFVKGSAGISNFGVYGMTNYQYVYLYDEYKNIVYNASMIRVGNVDIETDSQNGFGNIREADREIVSITIKVLRENVVYVLGLKDYEPQEAELKNYDIKYIKCANETELLLRFIRIWDHLELDALIGWNSKFFDIPYIMKRIIWNLSEEHTKKLSPFGIINKSEEIVFNKPNDCYEIVGIPHLDYIDVYKKFSTPVNGKEESYALNYLSSKLLNLTKLDYSEYKTLARLYNGNIPVDDVEAPYKDKSLNYRWMRIKKKLEAKKNVS